MKLWKYAILGTIARAVMIFTHDAGLDLIAGALFIGIIAWWAFCDIKEWWSNRKEDSKWINPTSDLK